MKPFEIRTGIEEYSTFGDFARAFEIGANDLVITNRYIFEPVIAPLGLGVQTLFQEEYGLGEPTDVMIDGILAALEKTRFARILAVGGGTVIDIAKAAAVAGPRMRVDDLYAAGASLKREHPLIVIPTTCGTGSEATNISVINRTRMGTKMGLAADALYAERAILIEEFLMSLPYGVFATSSMDAMIHAVESYLSPNGCSTSRVFSEAALKTIVANWLWYLEQGGGEHWKDCAGEFLRASNWAGIAFGYAGCAAVHATSYPIGGVYHVPHGKSNQLMFEAVMRKYVEIDPNGRIRSLSDMLAQALSCSRGEALDKLCELMDRVQKKEKLRDVGVRSEDIPVFADEVISSQQRLLKNNYAPLSRDDIVAIYRSAF